MSEEPIKKKGELQLSANEVSYIEQNWKTQTDQEIADALKRHVATVTKYRRINGWNKNSTEASQRTVAEVVNDSTLSEKDKTQFIKKDIKNSSRRTRLQAMFSEDDLNYFDSRWVDYRVQFKDMTPSEEDVLEKMIVLDIRMTYNQRSLRELHDLQARLKVQLSSKTELDPEDDKELMILQTIQSYNGQEVELNKQYALLLKEYQEIQKSLNATREQRETNQKIGAETFNDLIKKFNEQEFRLKSGREAELNRIAMDKKREELSKPHQYVDGKVDLPILTVENFKKANLG